MEDEKYYCGPKGTPKFLRSDFFAEACKVHDLDYKYTVVKRKYADKVFLKSMLSISKTKMRSAQAYLLYFIVRGFGWIFYGK